MRLRCGVLVGVVVLLLGGCTLGPPPDYLRAQGAGAAGRVGDIAVVDALVAYDGPIEASEVYEPGATARLQATIVNEGEVPDRLVSISSPVAGGAEIVGDPTLLPQETLAAGYRELPAAVTLPGTTPIELLLTDLLEPIESGLLYPVVFTFARSGELRLELPVGNPDEPRTACPLPPDGEPPGVLVAPIGEAPQPPAAIPDADCSSLVSTEVELLRVEAPLHHPVWATGPNALLALVDEGPRRIVRVDPETGEILAEHDAEGAGENFALISEPADRVALPLPPQAQVVLLDPATLAEVGRVPAGPAPSWVAVQDASTTLFAITGDGSTVTAVDYTTGVPRLEVAVVAGPQAVVETDPGLTDASFWVVAPEGATYVASGASPAPDPTYPVPLRHETFSPAIDTPLSAYLAERGTSQVELLRSGAPADGLTVPEATDLGGVVEHVAAGIPQRSVYAVTATEVVTLEFGTLDVVARTEYRSELRGAGLGDARIAGVAVGDRYVHLTLEDQPWVVKVRK